MKFIEILNVRKSAHLRDMVNTNDNFLIILFIIIASWLLNYLLIQGFGLYHDDWPAMADFTKLKLWNVSGPLDWFVRWPHGRPLGWFLLSVLGWPARESGQLIYLYLVGFVIVTSISILIYFIIEKKFGRVAGLLSAFLFLASPADTTRLEVTLNFIAHTGLIFSLLGILLYQHNKIYLSYGISILALLCYESTFFPFVAAPLLALSIYSLGAWKKQILHGLICVALIGVVSAVRYWGFDSSFAVHPGQQSRNMFDALFSGIWVYSAHFFSIFLWGIKQGFKNITVLSVTLGLLISLAIVSIITCSKAYKEGFDRRRLHELLFIGLILLTLGVVTSGFAEYYPHLPYGGRNTRVYLAATFGGGAVFSAFLLLGISYANKYRLGPLALFVSFFVIFGVSSNALKIQKDYVDSWAVDKQVFRSAIELSCDAEPGDSIFLIPAVLPWDKGRAIQPYGFGYSTAIADTFDWGEMHVLKIPRLMIAHKNWQKYLELRDDGKLHWKSQKLNAFPVLALAPVEPGSIIYLKGTKRGLTRINDAIMVDGVNIIKKNPQNPPTDKCIFRSKDLNGPLAPFIYPDIMTLS